MIIAECKSLTLCTFANVLVKPDHFLDFIAPLMVTNTIKMKTKWTECHFTCTVYDQKDLLE